MLRTNTCCVLVACFVSISAMANKNDNAAAAIIDNQIITNQQVNEAIEDKLYKAELAIYELKLNQLKSMLLLRLIDSHPFSKGIKPNQFIDKFITKSPSATELEVQQLIEANKVPKERINADFKKKAAQYIVGEKSRIAIEKWFAIQARVHGVVINLKRPTRPRIDIPIGDAPTLGNNNAPITIVEYSDFQCPYCAKAEQTLQKLLQNYGKDIYLVYKQYPLSFHKEAFKASEASLCANEQSTEFFWKLHNEMFNDPRHLRVGELKDKAAALGLDKKAFSQCLDSGKFANQVNADIAEGTRFGVNSTPIFFVNGRLVRGAKPYTEFEKIIKEELATAR